MIQKYLESRFKANKLHNSWLIQTSNLPATLLELQGFIRQYLLKDQVDFENHPDYKILERKQSASKNITVDQVRELQDFLHKTSIFSGYKIAIFYQADLMNINAANSCLKILEDTPKNTHIFLLTNRAHSILPTIRSRCAKFTVRQNSAAADNFDIDSMLENSEYINSIKLMMNATNLEEKLAQLKNFAEKDRESWSNFCNNIIMLLAKLVKKTANIQVQLHQFENQILDQFRSASPLYLLQKYEKIRKLIDNTMQYDLDLRCSYILLMEELKH